MAYLGNMDGDEREMFQSLIAHFVNRLNEERRLVAELQRKLATADERISLLEAAAYGLF